MPDDVEQLGFIFEDQPPPEVVAALSEAKAALRRLGGLLDSVEPETLDIETWLEALAAVGVAQRTLQAPGKVIGEALGIRSAKARIREYLLRRLGWVVTNYELAGVAGTLEWARRVRELSLEEGWDITAGPDGGLKPGEYRLEVSGVDFEKAERWRARNEVRRLIGSGGSRCLAYLQEIFPEAASKEDLAYVSRINEWPRRMRELAESGWSVVSSADDPTRPAGSYRLESLAQGAPRERRAIAQRHAVLERDHWTCQQCGAFPSMISSTRLQIHHKRHVEDGGGNDANNLVTLCEACHAGVHSSAGPTFDELLNPGDDPWRQGRPDGAPSREST